MMPTCGTGPALHCCSLLLRQVLVARYLVFAADLVDWAGQQQGEQQEESVQLHTGDTVTGDTVLHTALPAAGDGNIVFTYSFRQFLLLTT